MISFVFSSSNSIVDKLVFAYCIKLLSYRRQQKEFGNSKTLIYDFMKNKSLIKHLTRDLNAISPPNTHIDLLFFSRFRSWFDNHHYLIITHLNLCSVGELRRWNLENQLVSYQKESMNNFDALEIVIYFISKKRAFVCNYPHHQNPPKTDSTYTLAINASFQT